MDTCSVGAFEYANGRNLSISSSEAYLFNVNMPVKRLTKKDQTADLFVFLSTEPLTSENAFKLMI